MRVRTIATAALMLACACTPARKKVTGDIVRSIHFDGNGRFFSGHNDYQLQGAMAQRDSSFGIATFPLNYIAKPITLDRDVLQVDSFRLETWYAENGWFDARFLGWEVHQIRKQRPERAGMVRILGHVEPGIPSTIRNFTINGADSATHRVFASTIKRTGSVQEGGQFSMLLTDTTKESLLTMFSNNGFPYATVDVDVVAYPDEHVVDVVFDVDPGITARFGEITVEGDEAIAARIVRQTVQMEPGDTYDAEVLRRAQQRLFSLNTYAIVNIVPDLSDPTRRDVPLTIKVSEARFQTLRLGGGLEFNSSRLLPRGSFQYRHVHLFNRLIQAQLSGTLGYRIALDDVNNDTPWNYSLGLNLSTPRLAGPDWGLTSSISVTQQQLPAAYTYFNPELSVRVTHRFSEAVSINFGPTAEIYRVLGDDQGGLLARSLFGSGFDGDYRLATLNVGMTFDWRDDPLDTTRGTYYAWSVRQALPVFSEASDTRPYSFTDLFGEARTYRRIRTMDSRPFTLAMRGRAQMMISQTTDTDGTRVSIPYPERVFLGGSSNLRGFRVNHVGPYETVCTYRRPDTEEERRAQAGEVSNPFQNTPTADYEVSRRYLPVGGEASLLGSVEGRFGLPYGLSVVPFFDAGLLAPSVRDIHPQQIRFAGGIGARYASVVGPIRVDLAVRPLFPEDRGPRAVFGCDLTDDEPRGVDLISTFGGGKGEARNIPFALSLIITIGQTF